MSGKPFGCIGNTIRLSSGHYFNLADPKPDQFEFGDIASALSKICRFGGQLPTFYSVAEHSWNCWRRAIADGLTKGERIAVLMHDATEAFCGDVVNPLKVMLPEYAVIEKRIENVIGEKFGIEFDRHSDAVRKIDQEMLIAERNAILGQDREWNGESSVRKLDIQPEFWLPRLGELRLTNAAKDEGLL